MTQTRFPTTAGAVFGVVALGHLSRLLLSWPVVVAGWSVPAWISVVGLLAAGGLSAWGFALAASSRPRA